MAITSLDMNPKFSASNPSMNKRWPPLADKTSLPYKLTSLSRQKLAREATAPNPDIRRCLGHFRLHCSSMEWAQKDMTTRINSFEMEDDDEDEEEEVQQQQQEEKEIKELPLLGADHEDKNKVKGRKDDEDEEGSDRKPLHVRFQISVKPSTTTTTTTTPSQSSSSQSSTSSSPSSPSESENAKDGLLEKGISCIQKTRQHFWSNPGQCIPIRIAN